MPTYFWLECASVIVAAAVLGVGIYGLVRKPSIARVIAVIAASWLVIDALWLRNSTLMMQMIPWADVIVLADFVPFAAFALAAVMLRLSSGLLIYRGSFAAILVFCCLIYSYGVLFRPEPPLHDRWRDGVCLQSSNASCSAAAAATLLTIHDIPATEAEMADLCFTGDDGTSLQGVYRGLKLKTAGTPWTVEPFSGDVESIRSRPEPSFLSVGLGRWQNADRRYSEKWGWAPGVMHSVVLLRFIDGGKVIVADPGVGREHWYEQGLIDLWKGEGFRLVKR
jgi:hypothetical protein